MEHICICLDSVHVHNISASHRPLFAPLKPSNLLQPCAYAHTHRSSPYTMKKGLAITLLLLSAFALAHAGPGEPRHRLAVCCWDAWLSVLAMRSALLQLGFDSLDRERSLERALASDCTPAAASDCTPAAELSCSITATDSLHVVSVAPLLHYGDQLVSSSTGLPPDLQCTVQHWL